MNSTGPVFGKQPLRSLPILVQTGYLDALTFCISLRPSFVPFTFELVRVLKEALEIAEVDDVAKVRQQRKLQLLTNSRVVAIELLSVAMACPEFQATEHQEFRNRIIGVFFKTLTLRSKVSLPPSLGLSAFAHHAHLNGQEVVSVSKKGLSHVINQHKLPKELLQSSLRPVLLNLADHRKLSVPLLKGLARLLELLTNCFNVTLGGILPPLLTRITSPVARAAFFFCRSLFSPCVVVCPHMIEKLLEHLQKWTEPQKITNAKIWKEGEEIKIAAHIIDIFHLLPSAASKFLGKCTPPIHPSIHHREIAPPIGAREPVSWGREGWTH
jgi:transformation/transcription domain-associated protein